MNESVISRLQMIIEHYGLSVSAFAESIGVQRSSVSHVLSGRNKPSLDFVMKLVKTYPEVNLYWLLNGKGSFPNKDQAEYSTPIVENVIAREIKEEVPPTLDSQNNNTNEPVKIILIYGDGTFETFNTKNN